MKTIEENQFEKFILLFSSQIRNDLVKYENNIFIVNLLDIVLNVCKDKTPAKFYLLEKRILKL